MSTRIRMLNTMRIIFYFQQRKLLIRDTMRHSENCASHIVLAYHFLIVIGWNATHSVTNFIMPVDIKRNHCV